MLQFNLVENLLTAAPDDYMAQTVNVRSYNNEEIAEQMLKRGTLLTKADILAVLEVYQEVITDIISEGSAVTTPLFITQPSISGVFTSASDGFDASRHRININLNAGKLLRNAIQKVKTEKVQVTEPIPYLVEVKDILSNSVNELLTSGGVIQIRGSRLKFFEDKLDNGIFLIADNGTETRVTTIVENKPARLIAMLPGNLASGLYKLEVRSTYTTGSIVEVKQLRVGRFTKMLTI